MRLIAPAHQQLSLPVNVAALAKILDVANAFSTAENELWGGP